METNEISNNSLQRRNSIIEKNENLSKTDQALQNVENFIHDLQNTFEQEMTNIYAYYVNMKEVIENIVIEFPMIDITSKILFNEQI